MGHENSPAEAGFLCEIRQSCAVIDVEVRYQNQINGFWVVERVEKRQRVITIAPRMSSAIQKNVSTLVRVVEDKEKKKTMTKTTTTKKTMMN